MSTRRNDSTGKRRKIAYLTFDDGPCANTIKILALLKRYRVKGTFFVNGTSASNGRRIYRQILNEGHALGNHTYSHDYSSIYASTEAFLKDFNRLERLLQGTTGKRTVMFRFPGGSGIRLPKESGGSEMMRSIIKTLRRRGFYCCDWTIDSKDAIQPFPTAQQILKKVLKECLHDTEPIILFHDFSNRTVRVLPAIIRVLRKRGYRFDVLSPRSRIHLFIPPRRKRT